MSISKVKVLSAILFSIVILFIESCSRRWTVKEKQEFAQKCSLTDSVQNLALELTGFKQNEIENIIVREMHNGKIIDSFFIHPDKNRFDSLRTRSVAWIEHTIYIKDSYQIVISENQSFILSDMKIVMWPEYTMFSEGYGCEMGDYKIDGIRFEHNANPDFVKKGWKE
jgi:hypothetical protein